MHFSVDTKIFKSAIDTVNHASVVTTVTPILENILIRAEFKRVVLTANNLEMAIEYSIEDDVNIQTEGSFTLSSRFLTSFISLVQDDKINVKLLSGGSVELKTAKSDIKIKGSEASKFPVLPSFQVNQAIVLDSDDLKTAFDRTFFSVAEWNVRPTLAGVYVKVSDGKIAFASTDSFRLSEFVLETETEEFPKAEMIIPAKTVLELSRILPEKTQVKIFIHDNQLLVTFGNIRLFSRLLNGHFPDYLAFFPKTHSTKAVVLRSDLISALKRVNLIAKENNYNVRVVFHSETWLEIATWDTEIGAGKVEIPASIEGEDSVVGINSAYLLEVLSVIKEDHASLDFETNLSPIVVKGVPDVSKKARFKHIIMPLKI